MPSHFARDLYATFQHTNPARAPGQALGKEGCVRTYFWWHVINQRRFTNGIHSIVLSLRRSQAVHARPGSDRLPDVRSSVLPQVLQFASKGEGRPSEEATTVSSVRTRFRCRKSTFRAVPGPADRLPSPAGLRVCSATLSGREHTSSSTPTAATSAVCLPTLHALRVVERDRRSPLRHVWRHALTVDPFRAYRRRPGFPP